VQNPSRIFKPALLGKFEKSEILFGGLQNLLAKSQNINL